MVTDPREGIVDWTVLMLVILPIVACFIDIREFSWFKSCLVLWTLRSISWFNICLDSCSGWDCPFEISLSHFWNKDAPTWWLFLVLDQRI